jgi:hypothetical protein
MAKSFFEVLLPFLIRMIINHRDHRGHRGKINSVFSVSSVSSVVKKTIHKIKR